eukprot:PhF_6_TR15901/c1_g1_i1/m.24505
MMFLIFLHCFLALFHTQVDGKYYLFHNNKVFSVTSVSSSSTFSGFNVQIADGITTLDKLLLSNSVTGYTATWTSPTLTVTSTTGTKFSASIITDVLNQVMFYTTSTSTAKRLLTWQFTGGTTTGVTNPEGSLLIFYDAPILQTATELSIFDSISLPSSSDLFGGFVVIIEQNFLSGDELRFSATGYTTTYASGKLTVTTTTNVLASELAAKIRTVRFYTTSTSTLKRRITFSMQSVGSTALFYSGTGHFYEHTSVTGIIFSTAQAACTAKSVQGWPGYIMTITSDVETSAIQFLGTHGFLGGSDIATFGTWKWLGGPEAGTTFYKDGQCLTYCYWGNGEPNNVGGSEHYMSIGYKGGAYWTDVRADDTNAEVSGYFCEFGGYVNDAALAYTRMGVVDVYKASRTGSSTPEQTIEYSMTFTKSTSQTYTDSVTADATVVTRAKKRTSSKSLVTPPPATPTPPTPVPPTPIPPTPSVSPTSTPSSTPVPSVTRVPTPTPSLLPVVTTTPSPPVQPVTPSPTPITTITPSPSTPSPSLLSSPSPSPELPTPSPSVTLEPQNSTREPVTNGPSTSQTPIPTLPPQCLNNVTKPLDTKQSSTGFVVAFTGSVQI